MTKRIQGVPFNLGAEPLQTILQMQAEFIKKIQWQPTRLSVGSAAAETLKTDNNILFLGRGVHVNEDGKFAPLPSLEYHESEEIDQDFAQLSCEANC